MEKKYNGVTNEEKTALCKGNSLNCELSKILWDLLEKLPCPDCGGRGRFDDIECEKCKGEGFI